MPVTNLIIFHPDLDHACAQDVLPRYKVAHQSSHQDPFPKIEEAYWTHQFQEMLMEISMKPIWQGCQ